MQKQEETEKLICSKLLAMMEKQPFQSIHVTDLVKFAGISRSTFYVYFDSVYAVVQKIEDDFINGLTAEDEVTLEGVASARSISPAFIAKSEYVRDHIDALRILTSDNGDPGFQARLANRAWRILKNRLSSCSQYSEAEKKLVCEYICGGVLNYYRWYSLHEDEISVYDLQILLEKLIKNALKLMQ